MGTISVVVGFAVGVALMMTVAYLTDNDDDEDEGDNDDAAEGGDKDKACEDTAAGGGAGAGAGTGAGGGADNATASQAAAVTVNTSYGATGSSSSSDATPPVPERKHSARLRWSAVASAIKSVHTDRAGPSPRMAAVVESAAAKAGSPLASCDPEARMQAVAAHTPLVAGAAVGTPRLNARGRIGKVIQAQLLAKLRREMARARASQEHAAGSTIGGSLSERQAAAADAVLSSRLDDDPYPASFAIAVAVDSLMDGLLLGIVFVASEKAGWVMAISTAIEMCSLGNCVALTLQTQRLSKSVPTVIAFPLILVIGGVLGSLGTNELTAYPDVFQGVLAFGVATLLYLVTHELLVEAHEGCEGSTMLSLWVFVGFVAVLMGARIESAHSG